MRTGGAAHYGTKNVIKYARVIHGKWVYLDARSESWNFKAVSRMLEVTRRNYKLHLGILEVTRRNYELHLQS